MALTDESTGNGFYMPVAPAYGGNSGGGFFGNSGDWAWIILLLLIGGGGWGFGGMGGMMWPMMMGGMGGGFGLDYLYPWLNNSEHISDGFRDQQMSSAISGLQTSVVSGFGDVQNSLCAGFAGVNAGIANAAAQAEISANARQMANMQQIFGVQNALQQCCCDNRAATQDLKYTIATEACATRTANTQNTQAILDKLCALELENVKAELAAEQRENANLRSDLQYARGQASQIDQTAQIIANNAAAVDSLYNRLKNCPVGTYSVSNPTAVGCGCGG